MSRGRSFSCRREQRTESRILSAWIWTRTGRRRRTRTRVSHWTGLKEEDQDLDPMEENQDLRSSGPGTQTRQQVRLEAPNCVKPLQLPDLNHQPPEGKQTWKFCLETSFLVQLLSSDFKLWWLYDVKTEVCWAAETNCGVGRFNLCVRF